jgi:glycosyltransferase involved in cell wall biosynthesis
MAAKVDSADRAYFDTVIRPMLSDGGVEMVGEISEAEKSSFLSGAMALLMPIDWPEPFGLVMIEAMACGVPVIAFNRGSVPEIIQDGHTGFIVEDEIGAIAAVFRLSHLSRKSVRSEFLRRFTARRMAEDYLTIYRSLVAQRGAVRSVRLEAAE